MTFAIVLNNGNQNSDQAFRSTFGVVLSESVTDVTASWGHLPFVLHVKAVWCIIHNMSLMVRWANKSGWRIWINMKMENPGLDFCSYTFAWNWGENVNVTMFDNENGFYYCMMTLCHGNVFHITDLLWGESNSPSPCCWFYLASQNQPRGCFTNDCNITNSNLR